MRQLTQAITMVLMDDVGQIPSDVFAEGAKVSKGVAKGVAETLGAVTGQFTGKKPKKQSDPVEELRARDDEFKKRAQAEILARLRRIQAEEQRLRELREQEKKDWSLAQKEKLAPPQIERVEKPKVLPQVRKLRPETKVGWGAG